jgi:hypothetical protein
MTKGSSTGQAPIHVSKEAIERKAQNKVLFKGYSCEDRKFEILVKGMIKRIRIDSTKATTPPSLLGIDRRTA